MINTDILGMMAPQFRSLEPYSPIEPVDVLSARLGIPEDKLVKLDGNENPYGPSPRAREALASFRWYNIYPDPLQRELRDALAKYTGAASEHILVGNGSDELIDLTMRLFLTPGDKVISCPPTFGMYKFNTEVCGGEIVEIPRVGGLYLDIEAIKNAVDRRTKLIFICSPNNPTGNTVSNEEITELLSTGAVVIVDEAYFEFCGCTAVPLVPYKDRLIVLRTFSKWAALAGLRVGYGIFPAVIAETILRMKPPYNVNVAALVAAKATLDDLDRQQKVVRAITDERHRLYSGLSNIPFLKPTPSQANFILCSLKEGSAANLKAFLMEQGILIKQIDSAPFTNAIRVSVGRPEDTDALLQALGQWDIQ
ncbi:MAG: histidinol-phosphate transaminase [Dehalococcoidia bacterium]|nr:histidinol-phosphate transaminase [Dehalococcoidia bacterium]